MTTTPFDSNRSVASLTIAELETFVRQTVQQAEKYQQKCLIPLQTDRYSHFDRSAPPFWEMVAECAAKIPEEVWVTAPEVPPNKSSLSLRFMKPVL
ncbi:MAG: hypothetical protein SW833_27335 [Cyanobacteriota bacterium]|nr:hypothetical protein [Cyanobacteriota bacterium]